MLGLGVDADADGQLYPPLRCSLEEREEPVAGRVAGSIRVLVEVTDLSFINGDRQYLFLLELVRVVLIALDHHQSLVLVQADLGGHEKDLREEVSLLQDLLIVGLL